MSEMLQDRVPPQSIEAEQATLGSIFLETDALITAMEYIVPEDFYRRGHQLIFRGMIQLNDRNEAIDVVTVKELLEQQNQLEDAGGLSYLSELALSVPTAANVGYYAKIVEEKSLLRNLIQTATNIVTQGFEQGDDVQTILDAAERNIMEVSERRNKSGFLTISEVLNTAIENIDQLARNDEEITGLPTGYA
ncbi:MAG: DnaB-like helicase N-terminal domain-containing protein, partial [Enterococcus hulanensis]